MKYRQVNCPDNFISDSINLNGTFFLICRALTESEQKNDDLTVGLILGLGIPLGAALILCMIYYKVKGSRRIISTTPVEAEKALVDEVASRNYDFQIKTEK